MKRNFSDDFWWRKLLLPLFLIILGLYLSSISAPVQVNRFVYDYISTWSARTPAEEIVIIAIDSESLVHYGQWPWPREIHANLIDKIAIGGAKAIGFDIVMSEPDRTDGHNDRLLAQAMKRSNKVVLPVFAEQNVSSSGLHLVKPIPVLAEAAARLGHVDFELDADGIVRRTYLKGGIGHPEWPAFALAILQTAHCNVKKDAADTSFAARSTSGNWVRSHEVLLSFAGKPRYFRQISYAAFMKPDFDPTLLRDKIVLVGTTASSLGGALPTPVSGQSLLMSGVEINANLLNTLSHDLIIKPMSRNARMLLSMVLILCVLLCYTITSQRIIQFAFIGAITGVLFLSSFLLLIKQIWFPPAAVLFTLFLSYPLWAWRRLDQLVASLFAEREQALVTLHSITDGIITTDSSCMIKYINPTTEKLTGQVNEKAVGRPLHEVFTIEDEQSGKNGEDIVRECLEISQTVCFQNEAHYLDMKGRSHILKINAGPLRNKNGQVCGALLAINDITEKKEALARLTYQATHDPLTNLPNRALLFDRLEQAIIRAARYGEYVAILFLDLDNFKKVNDQIGHSGGDRLLQIIAERMQSACRESDTIARLGGDEFIILLEGFTDTTIVAAVADKLLQLLRAPFSINNHEFYTSGSLGISLFPKDGNDAEQLVKNADIAMYEAKKSGRNNLLFFSGEMNELIQERLRLENQLRVALSRSTLELYYQPQVRLKDGKIVGVEALARWETGDKSRISPSSFIPVAEESGLILPLSEWVLSTACSQAKTWQEEIRYPVRVSINISPRHFLEDTLQEQLERVIQKTGIDPQNLELEITEGLIMQDIDKSVNIMQNFNRMGGFISIDDFGTGYSSLAYLKEFPLHKLKIDKSFINGLDKDRKNARIVKTIITMGHSLGLEVVAEGVETDKQLSILRELECDLVQGYYFFRPLPVDELTRLLNESSSDRVASEAFRSNLSLQ